MSTEKVLKKMILIGEGGGGGGGAFFVARAYIKKSTCKNLDLLKTWPHGRESWVLMTFES